MPASPLANNQYMTLSSKENLHIPSNHEDDSIMQSPVMFEREEEVIDI